MSTKNTQNIPQSKIFPKMKETDSNFPALVKRFVLGIGITDETEENILEYIIKNLPKQQKPYYIVTPNPEMIVLTNKDSRFKSVLNNAQIALCDGMQLYRAARLLGVPLKSRIVGTDFVEKLCEKVANRPITVGFLGAQGEIAERASECLKQKYPGLKVVFAGSAWNDTGSLPHFSEAFGNKRIHQPQVHASLSEIRHQSNIKSESMSKSNFNSLQNEQAPIVNNTQRTSIIDILFVAFGFPKQEQWMQEHVGKIRVKVMVGVGGALDQIVDPSLRPPAWVHSAGLGWLYRLARQPWRIKRQIKLVQFAGLVLQGKFGKN